LSNHDVARHVSRYARPQTDRPTRFLDELTDRPADLDVGARRARAAVLLMLALPGCAYAYLGEELGLPEVEDLPEEALVDPMWERSGRTHRGRDGCRVPLPWSGTASPYGFSEKDDVPLWLPQPDDWACYTVSAQDGDPHSMLELYRAALRLRQAHPALGDGPMEWSLGPAQTLVFTRDPGFRCVVNISAGPIPLPQDGEVLLASTDLGIPGQLPVDSAVWLAVPPNPIHDRCGETSEALTSRHRFLGGPPVRPASDRRGG